MKNVKHMTTAENNQPSSVASERRPLTGAVLGWFKTEAFPEFEGLDYVPSVQVALRHRLRLSYWLRGCQTITPDVLARACKAVALADLQEGEHPKPIAQRHIDEVMTQCRGFQPVITLETGELIGWDVPDLLAQMQQATSAYQAGQEARSQKATKAAMARWADSRDARKKNPQSAVSVDRPAESLSMGSGAVEVDF